MNYQLADFKKWFFAQNFTENSINFLEKKLQAIEQIKEELTKENLTFGVYLEYLTQNNSQEEELTDLQQALLWWKETIDNNKMKIKNVGITNKQITAINNILSKEEALNSLKEQVQQTLETEFNLSSARVQQEVTADFKTQLADFSNLSIYGRSGADNQTSARKLRVWANTFLAVLLIKERLEKLTDPAIAQETKKAIENDFISLLDHQSKNDNFITDEGALELEKWGYQLWENLQNFAIERVSSQLEELEKNGIEVESDLNNAGIAGEVGKWEFEQNTWKEAIKLHTNPDDLKELEKNIREKIASLQQTLANNLNRYYWTCSNCKFQFTVLGDESCKRCGWLKKHSY